MAGTFLSIGAGPGIGLATAKRFAAEGYKVVLAARNAERLAETADEVRRGPNAGVEVALVNCSDSAGVASLVDGHASELAVLHYNAAVLRAESLQAQSIESVGADMDVDVTGALVAARQAYAAMMLRRSGTILFTGGILASKPVADMLTLSISKAALRCAAQALFPGFATQGVHVAVLTIAASIRPGSPEATDVGNAFWALHAQPHDQWQWEAAYP
jgi:NADP-dependent 3-hydroxy acid dehydrogenase YdfG